MLALNDWGKMAWRNCTIPIIGHHLNQHKMETYTEKREVLVLLIHNYENKLISFLDYPTASKMTIDQLQYEYEYAEKLLDLYQGELLLLEANKILEVKKVSLPKTSIIKRIWRSFLHLITFY